MEILQKAEKRIEQNLEEGEVDWGSYLISYALKVICYLLVLPAMAGVTVLNITTYRVMYGEILTTGGLNEGMALIDLLIMMCLFRQRDYTKEEIQEKMALFENKLMNEEEEEPLNENDADVLNQAPQLNGVGIGDAMPVGVEAHN